MSDEPGEILPDGVPPFDDPAYDDLRGLLAGARATEPMPADVAGRLDDVLAGLRAESLEEALGPVPVTARRRTGARWLVAAAAVVGIAAGGVGLAQVVGGPGGRSADKAASEAVAGDTAGGSDTTSGTAGGIVRGLAPDSRLHKKTFAADAARVLAPAATAAPAVPAPSDTLDQSYSTNDKAPLASAKVSACAAPTPAGAVRYPILLDGTPATLVVHRASAGHRLVQAWSCDGSHVLASATLPD